MLERVMNSAEKLHRNANVSFSPVLPQSSVFRISKPFLSCLKSLGWDCECSITDLRNGILVIVLWPNQRSKCRPHPFSDSFKAGVQLRRTPIPCPPMNKARAGRAAAIRPWPSNCCLSRSEFDSNDLL
jgi:hypothetical protein